MKYEYLLPIGSIVTLKDMKRSFMIFGYLQASRNDPNKLYDYAAVPYPEGLQDMRLNIGFNHDTIESVVFRGYEDDQRKALLLLFEMVDKKRKIMGDNKKISAVRKGE